MKNKYMADHPVEGRECGDCTACCVLPRIQSRPELTSLPLLPQGKPGYTPCQFLGDGGGCGRYDERPQVCQEFECLWKIGLIAGDDRRRPDNLGLMFTLDLIEDKPHIEAWELWTGAALNHPGRAILDSIQHDTGRLMVRYYGVPCSVYYDGGISPTDGFRLSMATRNDPKGLARWLRKQADEHHMVDDMDKTCGLDVAALEQGVPVQVHFQPK